MWYAVYTTESLENNIFHIVSEEKCQKMLGNYSPLKQCGCVTLSASDWSLWLYFCLCGTKRKGGSEILIIMPFVRCCAIPCSMLNRSTCFRCLEWAYWKIWNKALTIESVCSYSINPEKHLLQKENVTCIQLLQTSYFKPVLFSDIG